MEVIAVARTLRALSVRHSNVQPKRFVVSASLGAFLALLALSPFAMSDAQATLATTVGTLPGAASVSATGAATYTIPITLPPGTHGMQPSLALTYNSQSGDGLAGFGWTLSGMSSITRCAADKEDDGYTAPVEFISSDDYCLDGQRLALTSGTQGGAGATYGKQFEDFSVITSRVDSAANNGPSWFGVQTKDGRIYEYGRTTASGSKVYAPGMNNTVRVWALDKVTDPNGNYMTFEYGSNSAGTEYFPTEIDYTGNGGTAPDHTVTFAYIIRPAGSSKAFYEGGALIVNSRELSSITVSTGTVSYKYSLNYGGDSVSGRRQLQSVQECGTDGSCIPATTIAWQDAQAGWGPDQDTGVAVAGTSHALDAHLADIDGDGIKDLLFTNGSSGTWMVMFGQAGGGFGAPRDTGDTIIGSTSNAIAMNYDGDGLTDIAVPTPGVGGWQVYRSTGSRATGMGGIFITPTNNLPDLSANNSVSGQPIYVGNIWPVHFKGYGGRTDFVYSDGVHLNLLTNNGGSFSGPTTVFTSNNTSRYVDETFVDVGVDFDGSGRAGGLVFKGASTTGSWLGLVVNTSNNAFVTMDTISANLDSNGSQFDALPLDSNGDGLSDVLSADASGTLQVSLSTGAGFVTLSEGLMQSSAPADPVVADYYADGAQVAIVKVTGPAWDILDTQFTPSSGIFSATQTTLSSAPYTQANYVSGSLRVGNISASGLDDLVYATITTGSVFHWHYRLHNGGAPDLVTGITDGLGNTAAFKYASLSDGTVYTKGSSAAYPIEDIQTPMQVVSQYTMTPASTGTAAYHMNYAYSGAQIDTNGRGFLGFATMSVTDSRNGNVDTKSYSQTFPWTGIVISDVLAKSTGDKISDVENTGPDNLPLTGRKFPFFDSSTVTDYDFVGSTVQPIRVTTTTLSTSSFDSYGNLLTSNTTVGQAGSPLPAPSFSSTTTTQYATPGSTYCVDLPSQETVTRQDPPGTGTLMSRVVTATQDTTLCQPNSQTTASGQSGDGSQPLTTTYASRDAYGNATEVDVSTPGATTLLRKTAYNFTGGNNEFPTTTTNTVSPTVSLVSHATWNYALGLKSTSTDPNGNQTTMAYDGFGRLTTVTKPDGSGSAMAYAACPGAGATYCPSGAAYEVTASVFNNLSGAGKVTIVTGYTAYDSLGRAIEQGKVLLGGGISRIDTAYDVLGDVVRVSKPFLGTAPGYATTYTFDSAMGRPTAVSMPQDQADTCSPTCGGSVAIGYSGLTTTVTRSITNAASSSSSSQTTQTTVDLIGETVSAVDANGGSMSYGYDAFGDLTSTEDAGGKFTTVSYDGLGIKHGVIDPNLGGWTYQTDALGEVTCQTDAKLQSIVFGYDSVGRVLSKTETSPQSGPDCSPAPVDIVYTSTWVYDTATKGLGLPASVSDVNGFTRGYDYDGFSRSLDIITTPGSGAVSYIMTTGYDSFGRVSGLTYPATVSGVARFGVTYNYDSASGALSSISDTATSFVYWQAATGGGSSPVDAFGHILATVDGNSVSTVTAYDQATGAITGIGTGSGTSTSVQQLAYSWDGFGNLKQRCDANRGLAEGFTYDGLGQLLTSQVHTGGTPGSCALGSTAGAALTLTYNAGGSIHTRTNTGITVGTGTLSDTYAYGDPSHPYAVTGVSSIAGTYVYDADGNMTSGNGRTITWDADNLPTSIVSSGTVAGSITVSGSSSFSYGPDRQRYYQSESVGGNTVTTTYVGALFEVVSSMAGTQYRHDIAANGDVVAVHSIDQSGHASNAYIHPDHLGSTDALTDDTGAIAVDPVTGQQQVMSFDAFGLRRNPADWSYSLASTSVPGLNAYTGKGYTFQEQLDDVALVHMNGRVYDPTIYRFVSADPVVPGDRYAYLSNNPLNATDPTGYFGFSLSDLNPLNPSSPLNPITGPANVLKQGASTIKHGLSTLGDVTRAWTEDNFRLAVFGFNMQREIASDYTDGMRELISDYTAGVKAWARNTAHIYHQAANILEHPALYTEYQIPILGNLTNIEIRRSPILQEGGTIAASVLSDIWGPEIDAGWAAYLNDLKGNQSGFLNFREGTTTWLTDEAISYALDFGDLYENPCEMTATCSGDSTGLFADVGNWWGSLSTTNREGIKSLGRLAWHYYGEPKAEDLLGINHQ